MDLPVVAYDHPFKDNKHYEIQKGSGYKSVHMSVLSDPIFRDP